MQKTSSLQSKNLSPDDANNLVNHSFWRRLLDFIFGYDFFISYSWSDAGGYATALTHQLRAQGFEVFLDRDDYASREIQTFSRTGRRIVPIDFDGSLEWKTNDAPVVQYLPPELIRIREPASALRTGPSDQVVAAIRRTFNLVRQDKKRVRAFAVIALLLFILAISSTWFGYMARVNEQLAEQRSKTALSRQLAVDAVNQVRDDRLDWGCC
jgi:hypothetical protein